MENKIRFPDTVILIDAVMLSAIITDLKKNFEKILQRPLPDMDIAQFVINLVLDADIPLDNKGAQIILVYDQSTPKIQHCVPSVLETELNGVAFQDEMGEFIFSSLSPEGMVLREELYFDLLNIIAESADVKRMIILPSGHDQESISSFLDEIGNKDITFFGMDKPQKELNYSWQMLAYPIMQALGIKGDEIQ